MASFKHTLGAFALTWVAASAVAAPVEVIFDVTINTRTFHEWFAGENHVLTDPDYEPLSFSLAYQFDPDRVLTQHAVPGGPNLGYALTRFVGGTGSPIFTPLYPLVQAPTPEIAAPRSGSDTSYGKNMQAVGSSPDEAVPVKETLSVYSYAGWTMPDASAPGASMDYDHKQVIYFGQPGAPLSNDQLALLTGADALAFLQAQIGVLQVGAYSESGGILVQQFVDGVPQGTAGYYEDRGIDYRGDVTIRSVSAVPEADGLLMGMAGLAVVGLCLRGRRPSAVRDTLVSG